MSESAPTSTSSSGSDNLAEIHALENTVNDLSSSVKDWNFVYIGGTAVAVVVAIAVFWVQFRTIVKSMRLSDAQSELLAAKDRQLQADLKQKDVEIGAAKKAAAEANRTAEAEKLARAKIEERLAWRHISPATHTKLIDELTPFGNGQNSVGVSDVSGGDPETAGFADEIEKALNDSHWIVSRGRGNTMLPIPRGVICHIDTNIAAGKALAKACALLPTAHVEETPGSGNATLLVGLKPPP